MKINKNYLRVGENYLFSTIAAKTRAYQAAHPEQEIIKLSIGDVSRPLPKCVVNAMRQACADLGQAKTFHGYGPETGYAWLKDAIAQYYQTSKGVTLQPEEIIISDGAKSDVANILDIFDRKSTVAMCDPVYPVYLESNLMLGRKPKFFHATPANGFLPLPNKKIKADIIYLCNPCNPTGTHYNYAQLQQWVNFAIKTNAVLLYDAAYESFITDDQVPSSIYQLDGAKTCAIEICSLSKTAGFTGVRCGYTIVPKELKCGKVSLQRLWARRQTVKFNGASYVVQRGAAAVFSPEGLSAIKQNLAYYQRNVRVICQTLDKLQMSYVGGVYSPYVWVRCPDGMTSWQFFDYLLQEAGIVCTPGAGFGKNGQDYVRLTGFNSYTNTVKACKKLVSVLLPRG